MTHLTMTSTRSDRFGLRPVLLSGLVLAAAALSFGDGPGVLESRRAASDFELTADPDAPQWKGVAGVSTARNYQNEPIPGPPTEIRSRWTEKTLYLLYTCPFDELNLKPDPNPAVETPRLWNWEVAEAFIGTDFDHIARYKELQVSPQSEWVDLDINREDSKAARGMAWNSGWPALNSATACLGLSQHHSGLAPGTPARSSMIPRADSLETISKW